MEAPSTQRHRREYLKNKEKILARNKRYYLSHREERMKKMRLYGREYHRKLKMEVLTHYGNGKCGCVKCGLDDIRVLSIDHIDGSGYEQRKKPSHPHGRFYCWLKKHNYPEGFQTLCMNCQWIKKFENKEARKRYD